MIKEVTKKRLVEDNFDTSPSGLQLCFDRELFLKDEFNVDRFVMRQKKIVSLETLRDDLMQYFNILKNSLVELINQDYADFVNLSSNLVGLDKLIASVLQPIDKLKIDIEVVQKIINEVLSEVHSKTSQLKELNAKKEIIHSIESVERCIVRLEKWLNIQLEDSKSSSDDQSDNINQLALSDDKDFDLSDIENNPHEDIGLKLERVGNEFSKLQYFTRKCIQHSLMDILKPRIIKITCELQAKLEAYFISGINERNRKSIQLALRTYLSIDKVAVAETIYMEKICRQKFLKSELISINPETNTDLYFDKLLTFTKHNNDDLQICTTTEDNKNYEISSEFDLLVNSILSEVLHQLMNLPAQFFSPGNPDMFHYRYCRAMNCLHQLQLLCTSPHQYTRLVQLPAYTDFINKWSIPIYFQIRYQEISGNVENVAIENNLLLNDSNCQWKLSITHYINQSLRQCWQTNYYLPMLRHRFWKLNLQLLNFLYNYIKSINWTTIQIDVNSMNKYDRAVHLKMCIVHDLHKMIHYHHQQHHPDEDTSQELDLNWIYHELMQAAAATTSVNLEGESSTQFTKEQISCIQEILSDVSRDYQSIIHSFVESIQTVLVDQSCLSIKAVHDVPRQYRRTNKPWPTKPSNYVAGLIKPLGNFIEDNCGLFDINPQLKLIVLRPTIEKISLRFQEQIKELLISVKKMEDSLKKLKRTRGLLDDQSGMHQSASSSSLTGAVSTSVSDDDKIRRQISLDINEFRIKCLELIQLTELTELDDLVSNVEEMCNEENLQ